MILKIISALLSEKFLAKSLKKIKRFFKTFFRKLVRFLDVVISYLPKKLCRWVIPVQNDRIVFMTNTFNYTCNPKYICEKLLEQNIDCKIFWITDNVKAKRHTFPPDVKLLKIGTISCFKAVYSAKVWIDNGIAFSQYFDKKKNQVHIQTMHGSLGIKRLDNAVLSRNQRGFFGRRIVKRETKNTDLVLTNSLFEENVFRTVFWKDTPMLRLGHARTDILFSEDERLIKHLRQRVCEKYGIPYNKRFVLYGPTHRRGMTLGNLNIDFARLVQELEEKFHQEYVVLYRLHNRNAAMGKKIGVEGLVYNATSYPDMQELMLISDIAITDYSSWIYDYVLTKKPGFIYATDLARYNNVTGLYYPLEETPFPVCYNNETLMESVRNFDQAEYEHKVQAFLDEKQAVDDGHAAERIVEEIVRRMQA